MSETKLPYHRSTRRFNLPESIHGGMEEAIFAVLPERVIANFYEPHSENALLWNFFYPTSDTPIDLSYLISIPPLWGTESPAHEPEELVPYFWGYNLEGERLPLLDEALDAHMTDGPPTEVDLFLLGASNLILLEVKNLSAFGRCSRYSKRRCPEVHQQEPLESKRCQYWTDSELRFVERLDFGEIPFADPKPPCYRHYQLGRTLLVGTQLARTLNRTLWIWVIAPQKRWKALEPAWLDFTGRILDHDLWRRMRVLSWESLRK